MLKFVQLCGASLLLCGCITINTAVEAETSQTRTIAGFDGIEASSGIDVTFSCGDGPKAVIYGTTSDLDNTTVRVENHILHIERDSLFGNYRRSVRVTVISPNRITNLAVSSGARLAAPACALSPEHLAVSGSSGGVIKLAGSTNRLSAEVSSGASISPLPGTTVEAGEVSASANSGGSVKLCSVRHLNGRATTGGSITADIAETGDRFTLMGGSVTSRPCR